MAKTKNVKIWNEGNTKDLNIAKTPRQEFMTQQLKKIKTKTKAGDHRGAQADYEKYFKD
tara:strand:+ start:55 stop:231 length:177 start_codon:yes stop_codon:yes gene_type:complete